MEKMLLYCLISDKKGAENMEKYATQALARLNGLLSQTEALYHRLARQLGLADSAMRVLYILL